MGNWFQSSSLEPSPLLKQHGPRGIGGWAVCQVQPSQVEAGTKVMTLPETNIFAPENGWDMWVSGRVLKLIFVEIVVKIQAKPLVHCKDWRNQEWDWKDPSNTYLGIGWNRIGWLVTHTHLRVFCGKGLQIWTPYETQLPMTPANVYAVRGWYSSNIEKKIEKDVILDILIFWILFLLAILAF